MGNQHTLEVELAYLAGLIDGEGTITLERTGNRRLSGVTGLSPHVVIANTNEAIIQYAVQLFQRLGVNPHIKTQLKGYGSRQKTCYWVGMTGLTKSRKVLEPLLPYLVGKTAQARLVLDFIYYRGSTAEAKGKPYGTYEIGILEKIRALNFRGVSTTEDESLRKTKAIHITLQDRGDELLKGLEGNDSLLQHESVGLK